MSPGPGVPTSRAWNPAAKHRRRWDHTQGTQHPDTNPASWFTPGTLGVPQIRPPSRKGHTKAWERHACQARRNAAVPRRIPGKQVPRSASPGGHTRSLVTAGLWEALPPAGQQPHGVREWGPGEGGVGQDLGGGGRAETCPMRQQGGSWGHPEPRGSPVPRPGPWTRKWVLAGPDQEKKFQGLGWGRKRSALVH